MLTSLWKTNLDIVYCTLSALPSIKSVARVESASDLFIFQQKRVNNSYQCEDCNGSISKFIETCLRNSDSWCKFEELKGLIESDKDTGQIFEYLYTVFFPPFQLHNWLTERKYIYDLGRDRFQEDLLISNFENTFSSLAATYDEEKVQLLSTTYVFNLKRYSEDLLSCPHDSWNGLLDLHTIGVDFDDTLSVGDTVSRICKAALRNQQDYVTEVDNIYNELLEGYMNSYSEFMETNLASNESSALDLSVFLENYSNFERDALLPVESRAVLQGLTNDHILSVADDIPLQRGALKVLEFAMRRDPSVQIALISLNWSKKMITRAVPARMADGASYLASQRFIVHANELSVTGEVTDGLIDKRVTGPLEKAAILRDLIMRNERAGDGDKRTGTRQYSAARSVFVGDSAGDLAALLTADLGIVLGQSSTLRRICKHFGIALRPLDAVIASSFAGSVDQTEEVPVLFQADSWIHIGVVLFGREFSLSVLKT